MEVTGLSEPVGSGITRRAGKTRERAGGGRGGEGKGRASFAHEAEVPGKPIRTDTPTWKYPTVRGCGVLGPEERNEQDINQEPLACTWP